jgi:hypothetical protein
MWLHPIPILSAALSASIAAVVCINAVKHPMERVTQHHCTYRRRQYGFDGNDDDGFFQRRKAHRVQVDADVCIGMRAIILPGPSIGVGAVVGAAAVVTEDVAPYAIVAGMPALAIKKRFSESVVERLVSTRWWEWYYDTLKRRFEDLFEVDAFLEKYANS